MSQRLRGTVIGCGFFAENHLNAWATIPDVELVAVCDLDPAKAESAKQRFGAGKAYTDAAAMLRETKPDFVDIATTVPSHRPLVELAASLKVPAIVQKPFAPTLADCEAMVKACAEAGVPLMVHENFRFQTPLLAVRRVVESGALGQLTWGRVSFRTAYDVYANLPYLAEEEHLVILDLGEVESLYCQSQSIRPGLRGEDAHNLRTYALVMAAYESARTGQAERPVAWGPRARARRRFALE
jgi:predicted dehydrogenase